MNIGKCSDMSFILAYTHQSVVLSVCCTILINCFALQEPYTPGVLNHFQTCGHSHPSLSTYKLQGYKQGQFIETPWQFIKSAIKQGYYSQQIHITQYFLQ
jgi:hypothetical protein